MPNPGKYRGSPFESLVNKLNKLQKRKASISPQPCPIAGCTKTVLSVQQLYAHIQKFHQGFGKDNLGLFHGTIFEDLLNNLKQNKTEMFSHLCPVPECGNVITSRTQLYNHVNKRHPTLVNSQTESSHSSSISINESSSFIEQPFDSPSHLLVDHNVESPFILRATESDCDDTENDQESEKEDDLSDSVSLDLSDDDESEYNQFDQPLLTDISQLPSVSSCISQAKQHPYFVVILFQFFKFI